MPGTRLSPTAVKRMLDHLRDHLGVRDKERLEALRTLIGDGGRIRLSEALASLSPDKDRGAALTDLRQLRQRLRGATEDAGREFALDVDTRKKTAPEDRICWFAGEDLAAEGASALSRAETRDLDPSRTVAQDAIALPQIRDGKTVIRYFVSYARKNRKLADDLLARLETRFACSPKYLFESWTDQAIAPGDDWYVEVQRAIAQCDFGLLLVSHAFLASEFIREEEIPHFIPAPDQLPARQRRAVPVGLKPVPFDGTVDLKGLERLQVFRDEDGKFYGQRTTNTVKDRFADELFQRILGVLDKEPRLEDATPECFGIRNVTLAT